MTTICWDGEYLAADRGAWKNGHIDCVPTKIHRVMIDGAHALYATMGAAGFSRRMMAHICEPTHVPLPDWKDYAPTIEGGSAVGLIIFPFGVLYEVDAVGTRIHMEGHGPRKVFAAGGGREMALGALLAGASAQRAVEISVEFSDYGGHGVTVLKFDDPKGEQNGNG